MAKGNLRIKKFVYRGKHLDELLETKDENMLELYRSRVRRRLLRSKGLKGKYLKFLTKVKNSKLNLAPGEKPKTIKTHLRNCIIVPEMVGGVIACYSGKEFKEFEVKFDMIGTYVGEYSITYQPTLRKAAFAQKKKGKK